MMTKRKKEWTRNNKNYKRGEERRRLEGGKKK
jgi:hypothetical protein